MSTHTRLGVLAGLFAVAAVVPLIPDIALATTHFTAAGDVRLCAYAGTQLQTPCTTEVISSGANADMTLALDLPSGNVMRSLAVGFVPSTSTIGAPSVGAAAGKFYSGTRMGIINNSCNNALAPLGLLMNSSVDNNPGNLTDGLPAGEIGSEGPMEPFRDDADGNKLPQHVDRYLSFLNDLLDPDRVGDINGDGDDFDTGENPGAAPLTPYGDVEPIQPAARYSGSILVSGEAQLLQILVFQPGDMAAFQPPHPLSDLASPALGYPMLIVLNDPTREVGPSPITDVCSPGDTRIALWGRSRDNPCTASPSPCSNDDTPCIISSPCGDNSDINGLPGLVDSGTGPCSGSNEAGCVRYANPSSPGTHHLYIYQQSQRDTDGDGYENGLDTCPYQTNLQNPRTTAGPDGDMIDSACDPTPTVNTGSGNHDGDCVGTPVCSSWLNAGDNCPLLVNPDQKESESITPWVDAVPRGGPRTDQIGDACDNNDTRADGQFFTVFKDIPKCIGSTDSDGDGWCNSDESTYGSNPNSSGSTPEHYDFFVPLPLSHAGSGVNANVGGTVSPGLGVSPNPSSTNTQAGQPYQLCNDGIDNDGDGDADMLDDGCKPAGVSLLDTDGDGFSDEAEIHIGTDPLGRCEVGLSELSTDWPADFSSGGGSQDRVTLSDLTSFQFPAPQKLNTYPGDPGWNQRWDLVPNGYIALQDMTALLYGATGNPPMYAGIGDGAAFNNIACTAHPTYGD